jgi:hypothetical protein
VTFSKIMFNIPHQSEEEVSSAGEQLTSNKADGYTAIKWRL